MVPVKSVLVGCGKSIGEVTSWRDGKLSYARNTVHIWTSTLEEAMPMNCCLDRQIVLDKYFKIVSFFSFNQGPRLLVVDEVHFARESIRASDTCTESQFV